MKILITGGGCREAIDGVRFVTNFSTGRTSAFLADYLAAAGAEVRAVMGAGARLPENKAVQVEGFESGDDLSRAVEKAMAAASQEGKPYTAVIHAAAVSDFIPDTVTVGGESYKAGKALRKLHSGGEMTVTFRAAPKIADRIRLWAGKDSLLFCFKLTNGASDQEQQQAVDKLLSHSAADYIIRNDLTQISGESHPFRISDRQGKTAAQGNNLSDLGAALLALCRQQK